MKTRNIDGLALYVYAINYPPTVRVGERVTKDPALPERERQDLAL